MNQKIDNAISAGEARRVYDWLGARHDMGERFERTAKARALELLDLRPGLSVLNAGVGTGKEQTVIKEAIAPTGLAVGVDLSMVMLGLTLERTASPEPASLAMADIRRLPFRAAVFDRILCTYVLDLIPVADQPTIVAEFIRALKPDGKLVTVSLSEGATISSRSLVAAWKALYRISPIALGGCRPVKLSHTLLRAGFSNVQRELIIQLGMPSEILVATHC